MKLRSVALVGVMSLAVLGLIGTGAHAVFTTSTTSSQTITAGTWGAPPTVAITYPVNNTTYGSNWTRSITGTASSNSGRERALPPSRSPSRTPPRGSGGTAPRSAPLPRP